MLKRFSEFCRQDMQIEIFVFFSDEKCICAKSHSAFIIELYYESARNAFLQVCNYIQTQALVLPTQYILYPEQRLKTHDFRIQISRRLYIIAAKPRISSTRSVVYHQREALYRKRCSENRTMRSALSYSPSRLTGSEAAPRV